MDCEEIFEMEGVESKPPSACTSSKNITELLRLVRVLSTPSRGIQSELAQAVADVVAATWGKSSPAGGSPPRPGAERSPGPSTRVVVAALRAAGYDASVVRTPGATPQLNRSSVGGGWAAPGCSSGDVFAKLQNEFIQVLPRPGEHAASADSDDKGPVIVDVCFAEHFCIPSPTRTYEAVLRELPDVWVGGLARLEQLVCLLAEQMAASFAAHARPQPPWRRTASLLSKWIMGTRSYSYAVPAPPRSDGARWAPDGAGAWGTASRACSAALTG